MYSTDPTVATTAVSSGAIGAILATMAAFWLIFLVFAILVIVGMWKAFSKAGKPGWAAIIPIYNVIVLLEIAGRPIWWILLYLVPFVNLVITIIVSLDIAKAFGKSALFAIFGMVLFSPIGWLMLGFGSAKYAGVPNNSAPAAPATPATPAA